MKAEIIEEKRESELKKLVDYSSPSFEVGVIYANLYREVKRFLRAKSRVLGSIIQPIFWMIFFGLGFTNAFRAGGSAGGFGGVSYIDFLIPGVFMMTIFFSGFFSGISVIFDREFGYLKEILVSPAPRWATLFGRAIGSTIISLIQGLIILAIAYPIAPELNYLNLGIVLLAAVMLSLSFTAIGIIIAVRMRSHEGFQLLVNFLAMPLLFSSGAFFPIETMPDWMKIIAYINPLTYAVDISRYALVGIYSINPLTDFMVLGFISITLGLIASHLFGKSGL